MKYSVYLILTFIFVGCKSNEYNTKLIGDWNYIDNNDYGLIFTKDSLIIKSIFTTKQNWTSDESNIYLKNITDLNMNKVDEEDFRNHFVYKLSKNEDTLVFKWKTDTTNTYYKLARNK
ncbi:hypothetical protein [Hyunsoonleella ulvae]|uniref:hypothetical protein n=1 Tax=Hyunsoonleella ulvae TaxID=2799948 RepID=UPI00193AB102|nr:hypothetical protein [Hyunsoonleella ulvae]